MALGTSSRCSRVLAALAIAGPAHAIQTCELNSQPVNPNNGATTAGRTGLMRCRDADTGAVVREQELQGGRFMGVVRHFKDGQVEREFAIDERGNRTGLAREWRVEPGAPRVLVREESYRDGRTVGVARAWHPNGQRRRLALHGDDGREQALVEFDADGRLRDLRCAAAPVFGADFDDRAACGHEGRVSTVVLLDGRGRPATRIAFERGERRKVETLWDSGAVRELRETTAGGGVLQRSFAADGTKLREVQWAPPPAAAGDARPRGAVKVLEQEFHPSGKLVRETRWTPDDRGGADLASESRWYLNGQPKERVEYHAEADGRRLRRETLYFDDGRPSFEGAWIVGGAAGSRLDRAELPTGAHRRFDEQGRLRGERVHDDRGRVTREREFDEAGALTRDDEVFEDGSRKSRAR